MLPEINSAHNPLPNNRISTSMWLQRRRWAVDLRDFEVWIGRGFGGCGCKRSQSCTRVFTSSFPGGMISNMVCLANNRWNSDATHWSSMFPIVNMVPYAIVCVGGVSFRSMTRIPPRDWLCCFHVRPSPQHMCYSPASARPRRRM